MATLHQEICYHDSLHGESNLKIEVAREVDMCREGETLSEVNCDKNPGHRDFIPFKDLNLQDLPIKHRSQDTLESIKRQGKIVVKLVVRKEQNGIKRIEAGTGFVTKLYDQYLIVTNNHVVNSQADVDNCCIEFDYNSDDKSNVVYGRGVKLRWTCPNRDVSHFSFDPIPNDIRQLNLQDEGMTVPDLVIIYNDGRRIFEPSVARRDVDTMVFNSGRDLNDPHIFIMFLRFSDGSVGYLTSSFITSKSIPSNLQDLTDIEIHVDKDNGESKKLCANILKCGDCVLIKLPELVSQDEAKRCKIMRNKKVIGRGGRLYFNNIDPTEYFSGLSGIDYDMHMEMYPDKVWLFDIKHRPKELQNLFKNVSTPPEPGHNMCVIGHPHGNIKTITFGLFLGYGFERFDSNGRQIDNQDELCTCKEIRCMKYSCKACPGSSGSPALLLDNLSDYFILVHFMGKQISSIYNGVPIENMNTAWCF